VPAVALVILLLYITGFGFWMFYVLSVSFSILWSQVDGVIYTSSNVPGLDIFLYVSVACFIALILSFVLTIAAITPLRQKKRIGWNLMLASIVLAFVFLFYIGLVIASLIGTMAFWMLLCTIIFACFMYVAFRIRPFFIKKPKLEAGKTKLKISLFN
jgi:ABC-type polysaccharide/polyol phosphate export permease